jgi:hypothetical protein
MLPLVITTCHVIATVAHAAGKEQNSVEVLRKNVRVDHGFAVSKQRFTLGMPEGQHKTLVDLWEPGLVLRWSPRSLLDVDCFRNVDLIRPSEELKMVATAAARYRMLRSLPIVRRNELILVISKTQRQAPG